MEIKEFFKPEWKKFILPIVFIALFAVIMNSFLVYGSTVDSFSCELFTLIQEHVTNIEKNDTLAIEQTANEIESMYQYSQSALKPMQNVAPILFFIRIIDPLIPLPCVITYQVGYCEFYISKETHDCFKEQALRANNSIMMFVEKPELMEYRPVSFITISANVLLLFLEGYLLSSVILFGYRKKRNARPPTSSLRSDPTVQPARGI